MKRRAFILSIVIFFVLLTGQAVFAQAETRNCFGMLWCSVETKEGASFDALFYLYSTEERGSFSRLAIRPFYTRETDPEEDYLRRSILWPLGNYERKADRLSAHILPFYWHGRGSDRRYTLFLPIYLDYEEGLHSYFHIIPFYGHHRRGENYDRYFIFGPLSIITHDAERGLHQWDVLYPIFSHRKEKGGGRTWLLPVYLSGTNKQAGLFYRYLLNYGHKESTELDRRYLFPIFGSETEKIQGESRFSLIGLPPLSGFRLLPTLALYEHLKAPDRISDRFFPIYRYVQWLEEERTEIDALLLYRHDASPDRVTDRLFPFYRYEHDLENQSLRLSFIGHRELSLLWYEADAVTTRHHLFPVYSYRNTLEEGAQRFGLFGYGRFSFFLKEKTPTLSTHHLFPLYRYRQDLESGASQLNALLLYEHRSGPRGTIDRFIPFYRYENDLESQALRLAFIGHREASLFWYEADADATRHHLFPVYSYRNTLEGEQRLGLFGVGRFSLFLKKRSQTLSTHHLFPVYGSRSDEQGYRLSVLGLPPAGDGMTLSLYEYVETDLMTSNRFFPLYRYSDNRETGEVRWDALLIYQHKKTESYTKDTFLPVYSYENDRANEIWRFGMFGVSPLMLFEHRVTGQETSDHVFPLYGYRRTEDGRDFTMLGLPPSMGLLDLALIVDRRNSSGTINRFFPFYRYERDHEVLAIRFALIGLRELSLLWYEADPATTRNHLFPLYNYRRDSNEGTWGLGLVGYGDLSLYRHSRNINGLSNRLFPLYDYHADEEEDFLSLFGVSSFALYRKEKTSTYLSHRVFPIFRYRQDFESGESQLNALLLYEHRTGPKRTTDRFIPFYRYENDLESQALRLAFLGHREFSLFWYEDGAATTRHHLFPVYDYTRQGSDSSLSIGGISAVSLYRYRKDAVRTRHRFFPVYGYWKERETGEWNLGVLGIPPLSLYQHHSGPGGTSDRLFPIYRYTSDVEAGTSRLNVLGFREFSLYQHVTSPTGIKDRLIPLYDYQHDREKAETRFNALLIARYRNSPSQMKISFLPLFSYERDENRGESRIGFLGVEPISLYQHLKTAERVSDRFFPIYEYSYDRNNQADRLKILWPLFDRRSLKGKLTELSVLWRLMSYERPDERQKEFRVLGGSAIAMLRWKVTPELTRFEFNPLVPFYSYESMQGRGTKWEFLGGLVGQETNEAGDTKNRWFWFF